MENIKCALDTPYPQVRGTCSHRDLRMIMDLYSGREGELTAITQYLYQHYLTDGIDENMANILLKISKTEMMHHSLLGEAIVKVGGDLLTPARITGKETVPAHIPLLALDVKLKSVFLHENHSFSLSDAIIIAASGGDCKAAKRSASTG